jgi:hypothetical protein
VRTLVAGEIRAAGRHQVALDAAWLRPGVYLVRLRTDEGEATTPIVLVGR